MFSCASLFWAVGLSGGCREMVNLRMDCGLSAAVFEAGDLWVVCGLLLRRGICGWFAGCF